MVDVNIAALNRRRKTIRYSSLVTAVVDLAAIVMIMAGVRLPGVILGMAALVGGMVYKNKGKKAYREECCRLQTMNALGLANAEYLGKSEEGIAWMEQTHLLPTSAKLVQPLMMHAVKGELREIPLWISEATFGCVENGKKQPTYSSGVMVRIKLEKPAVDTALLLGRYAFKHAALRNEYEKDGMRLSPAGGKERGWYALTPGAVSPSENLLEKWDVLCNTVKSRAALYVNGDELTAFFYGSFYTGEFLLEEEVNALTFKRHTFVGLGPLMDLVENL